MDLILGGVDDLVKNRFERGTFRFAIFELSHTFMASCTISGFRLTFRAFELWLPIGLLDNFGLLSVSK